MSSEAERCRGRVDRTTRCFRLHQWESSSQATLFDSLIQQRRVYHTFLVDSSSASNQTTLRANQQDIGCANFDGFASISGSADSLAAFVSRQTKNRRAGTCPAREGAWPTSACSPLIDSRVRRGTRRERISSRCTVISSLRLRCMGMTAALSTRDRVDWSSAGISSSQRFNASVSGFIDVGTRAR